MHITVQHFNGCPHWLDAVANVQHAVEYSGLEADVRLQLVMNPDQAAALAFRGSPTVLIDGVDPFAAVDAPVGLSCRVYQTPDGIAGSPTVEQLTRVLEGDRP